MSNSTTRLERLETLLGKKNADDDFLVIEIVYHGASGDEVSERIRVAREQNRSKLFVILPKKVPLGQTQ
jgi:hypothetical protein